MSNKNRQHERKTKKHKERLKKEKTYLYEKEARMRLLRKYPLMSMNKTGADPKFISLVEQAVLQVNFDDHDQFSNWDRYALKKLVELGYKAAEPLIKKTAVEKHAEGDYKAYIALYFFELTLGSLLFNLIPESERKKYLPFNDMQVLFKGRGMFITFTQLLETSGPNGTAYYSRHRPKISIDGSEFTVAFSWHAIERICERLNPRWLTYAGAGQVHAVFSHCKRFDYVTLHNDQPAITFYDILSGPEFISHQTYMNHVLGGERLDPKRGKAYFRVGYCPIVIEGEFAKAKTFLYPGYTATPEYSLLLNSSLPYSEMVRLKQLAVNNDRDKTMLHQDVEVIRWFHENGVPQVIQTHEEIFDYLGGVVNVS